MSGPVRALYTSDAVRAIDRRTIVEHGISGHELMRRAGSAAFARLRRRWPEARRLLVLCGPGNNGGDGYVLATLALAAGFDVRVLAPLGPPRGGDAGQAAGDFEAAGGRVAKLTPTRAMAGIDVVIDALLGIGLARAPQGELADCIEAIDRRRPPVLALDVPTGIDADSGHAPGLRLHADLTVSFIAAKRGLYTGDAVDACGERVLESLDVEADAFRGIEADAELIDDAAMRALLPRRQRNAHKGDFGHVLAIGGDHGFGGAVRLCGEAALRAGAGLVSVTTRAAHVAALLAARPELMVADEGRLDTLLESASVVAIGPGLGQGDWGRVLFGRALAFEGARVFDADALNLLARAPFTLGARTVITPHPGEAARLLACDAGTVQRDRFAAVRALATKFGCVAVLKGAGTLVAAGGRVAVCAEGNPGMASGGMGDVLTGVIAALLAQGLAAFDAACCGVWMHAHAADAAARTGERGLLAGDVLAALRAAANP